jgi:uncharacterized protein with HEPN domain
MKGERPKKGDDAALIKAIIFYCDKIEQGRERFGDDEVEFLEDEFYQYSCSFCLFQIGEFVKVLSKDVTEKYPEMPWSDIAGMRDIIGHNYGKMSMRIVWKTITRDVPILMDVCNKILRDLGA